MHAAASARPRAPGFVDPPGYARHRPETTLLCQLVEQHYPAFRELCAAAGRPLPDYVQEEFDAYLKCGRLEEGFLRVRCEQCHAEKLVTCSCKKRGGKPRRQRLSNIQMLTLIRAIHAELKGAYGSPRMMRELRDRGFPASKPRVERLMRENGIKARHKRRYQATTDSKHSLPIAPNLLDRNFAPVAPSQVWTADMTYIWTAPPR